MDAHRSNDPSRRKVLLGMGASGLAAAMATQKVEMAIAQEERGGTTAAKKRFQQSSSGIRIICPPAGEGRFITDADGKPVDSGAMEMAFPLGTWCYTAPDALDGVRNDGTDKASLLIIELVPVET